MDVAATPATKADTTSNVGPLERSQVARATTIMKSLEDLELRNAVDIPMHHLTKKYAKEFQRAEEDINKRKENWKDSSRTSLFYDWDNDRRFQFWLKEKEDAKEHSSMHWIDEELDSLDLLTKHCMRVFSTVGIFQGIYRTHFLWKTMDRNYAKLHGVRLGSIASFELPVAILKGLAIGMAVGTAAMAGDICWRLLTCMWSNTVVRPRRDHTNVIAAGAFGGLVAGFCIKKVVQPMTTPRMSWLAFGTSWSICTAVSAYLAIAIYKPWVEEHPDSYDDPHHRPWQSRRIRIDGPRATRGRYQ